MYEEGISINFRCVVKGEFYFYYFWIFIFFFDFFKVFNLIIYLVYKIINVKKLNIGNYTCSVRNEINRTVYIDIKIVFFNIIGECRCRCMGRLINLMIFV